MKGYRTLIFNIVAGIGTAATLLGVDIPPEQLSSIATGLVSLITVENLILRKFTNTPMLEK